jgi:hypothetical protein
MQKFGYRLDLFSGIAKDVKTPEELYEAIDKLGPLPLYWTISVNNKQEDDRYDFESAKKEAHIVYEFARRISERLRKSKQIQTQLPPPTDDPFLGISTIKEWCTDVSQKQPTNNGKAGETSDGKTGSRSIDSQDKHEDIVMLKPNVYGIGLDINALIRRAGIKIKNLLKAFIYRKSPPK